MSDQTIPRRTVAPGEIFGRLTVLSEAPRRKHGRYWLCQCSCGSPPKEIHHYHLGVASNSCGCLRKETSSATGKHQIAQGKSSSPEYRVWYNMWKRCTDPKNIRYLGYKDRAPPEIWGDFHVFFDDMGARPSPKHSIERVDNSKPYGPDNCIWATNKEQARNTNTNLNIAYQGDVKCLSAWAEEYNIKAPTLRARLVRGWSIEKALTTKVRKLI